MGLFLFFLILGYNGNNDYVYTKFPGWGAETWQLVVVKEQNSQGQREVHMRNDFSSFYISYDGVELKGSLNEIAYTLFYYEEA